MGCWVFDRTACICPFGENCLLQATSKILPEIEQANGKDAHQYMSIINHLCCYLCTIHRFFWTIEILSISHVFNVFETKPHRCLPQSSVLSGVKFRNIFIPALWCMGSILTNGVKIILLRRKWPRWIIAWPYDGRTHSFLGPERV